MSDPLHPSYLLVRPSFTEASFYLGKHWKMVHMTSPTVQKRIRELHKDGHGRNAIARELKVSPKVVSKYLKLKVVRERRVVSKKLGRKSIVTPGVIMKARNFMKKNKTRTAMKVASGIGLKCKKDTALKLLRKLKCKKTKGKLRTHLTDSSKLKRLNFAYDHVSNTGRWQRTVFSDEKRFCLQGPDSYRYEWYLPGTAPKTEDQTARYKESFMVWGAIGYDYKCPLYVCEVSEDATFYCHLLALHFFPHAKERYPYGFFFIQDNAPPHRASLTQEFLKLQNCTVLTWPPYSPDLNCIENMWGLLSSAVYKDHPTYNTLGELEAAVLKAWDDIPMSKVNALVSSMPSRLKAAIKEEGGHTDY
jgi:predicted transcriptional regulator